MVALSPLVERMSGALTDLVRQVRSAPARVLLRETALSGLVLAVGVIPIPVSLVPSGNILGTAMTACWAALLVPARRRWPVATLVAMALVLAGPNIWAMAALPAITFSAARQITPVRRLWFAVLVTGGVTFALTLAMDLDEVGGFGEVVAGYAVSVLLMLALPASVGAMLGQRRPRVRLLRERNEYLERVQSLTAAKARVEERADIAGEMHDMLGHRLSLISIHAGALELGAAKDAPAVSGQAELLRTTAATALSELREILGVLRGTEDGLDQGTGEHIGTRCDIEALVTESRSAGIEVGLTWTGDDLDKADPRTRHAVHRVVREGLTNVHKHAPSARTGVEVSVQSDRVHVVVINGPARAGGRRLPGSRSGLVGLEERIALLDGTFRNGRTAEGGFRVSADLPSRPSVAERPGPGSMVPHEEPPEPLAAEPLTWPRVLGAGCLGLLSVVPVATGVIMLIVMLLAR